MKSSLREGKVAYRAFHTAYRHESAHSAQVNGKRELEADECDR